MSTKSNKDLFILIDLQSYSLSLLQKICLYKRKKIKEYFRVGPFFSASSFVFHLFLRGLDYLWTQPSHKYQRSPHVIGLQHFASSGLLQFARDWGCCTSIDLGKYSSYNQI